MSVANKTRKKNKAGTVRAMLLLLAAVMLAVLVIKSGVFKETPAETAEPVQIFDGSNYIWITPDERLEKSTLSVGDFEIDANGEPKYIGSEYTAVKGIDVSDYQGSIDWQQVYDSGVRFAVIRAGGRYYGEKGEMFTDGTFERNFDEAKKAGLKLGVYFFSQAVSTDEATAEAEYVLKLLDGRKTDLPVFFDWETIGGDSARTDDVDGTTLTDCAAAFCERIEKAGLKAGIYLYDYVAYHLYELGRLAEYPMWYAAQGKNPVFYYEHLLWQYSFEGKIPGIDGKCDLDMMFAERNVFD